jgi:hypothetical protein
MNKNKLYILTSVGGILLLIAITIIVRSSQHFNTSAAGAITSVEAESAATLSGAAIGNDANASGGKYIQFAGTGTTPTPTPIATLTKTPTPNPTSTGTS